MAMSDDSLPTFCIDPKDMTTSFAPPSPPSSSALSQSDMSHETPDQSVPKKKRKSWGQVLPKPTTNLPPRKRAKTAEEKQQRLYERVQRNRQAAHNSRMRKQDEMERAVSENNQLKQDNQHLQNEVQRLKEELAYIRSAQGLPSLDSNRSLTPPFDVLSSSHDDMHTSAPSLTSDSSIDVDSPEDTTSEPSPHSFPPPSEAKPFNDSHSAVDVEFASYLDGEEWLGGQNMNTSFVDVFDYSTATNHVNLDEILNLDCVADTGASHDNAWIADFEASTSPNFGLETIGHPCTETFC